MGELINIKKYSPEDKAAWDSFVDTTKNGSFHLKRDFVEYHRDRFVDHSLLLYQGTTLMAVVPACVSNNIFYSHQGLTYGGILVDQHIYLTAYVDLVQQLLNYLRKEGFEKFIIKEIPHTYTPVFNDDFDYVMQLIGAKITGFDVLPHVNIHHPIEYQTRRKRSINKAKGLNMQLEESEDLAAFWNILEEALSRHKAKPVHTLEEITLLKNKFPANIRLFMMFEAGLPLAGTLVFETEKVARTQYIASSEKGKETGALDLLFHELITKIYLNKSYLDFGTTTLNKGRKLSFGLSDQKEGFGARSVVQHTYEIDMKNMDFNIFAELKL
jgi:hypothetical protein